MSTPFTRVEPALDPAREVALGLAITFHEYTDSDDPRTVIATATEFLAFLTGSDKTTGPTAVLTCP